MEKTLEINANTNNYAQESERDFVTATWDVADRIFEKAWRPILALFALYIAAHLIYAFFIR